MKVPRHWTLSQRLAHYSVHGSAGCILWTAAKLQCGYGVLFWEGRSQYAHRLVWTVANGPIPKGFHILHKCDVPLCINPRHLFLGRHADNMADMVAKGRHVARQGEACGRSKLTETQVRAIYQAPGSLREVAHQFGISRAQVRRIKNRLAWKHLYGTTLERAQAGL
jgi:hypothetical protein